MKKLLTCLLLLYSFFIFKTQGLAKTTGNKLGKQDSLRNEQESQTESATIETNDDQETEQNRETLRVRTEERLEAREASASQKRLEVRMSIAQIHAQRLEKRFAYYYERLNKIITKISEKIALQKAAGKDTSQVEVNLEIAKDKMIAAKTYGDEAISKFNDIKADNYQGERDLAILARDDAWSARNSYQEVLQILKEIVKTLKELSL